MADRLSQGRAALRSLWPTGSTGKFVYLAISILTILCVAAGFSAHFAWEMGLLALLLIGIGWYRIWLVPLALLLIQADYFLTELPLEGRSQHGLGELLSAGAILAFVMAASRYIVLTSNVVAYYQPSIREKLAAPWQRLASPLQAADCSGVAPRDPGSFSIRELLTGTVRLLAALLVAASLLSMFPLDPSSAKLVGLIPTAHRTIRVGILLLVTGVCMQQIVEGLAWQMLSRDEARVYLQSLFTFEHQVDLRRIVQRQLRARRSRKPRQ